MILTDKNNTPELYASLYAKYKIEGTPYLAFRDLPELIAKYVTGKKTIDYGCGTGESTIFLKSLGLEVTGVDISQQMLSESVKKDPHGKYTQINSGKIPVENGIYDFVFSSFVLLEIDSKEEMQNIMTEIARVLKKGGIFITVLANENTYRYNWLTIDTNFPDNKSLHSGARVKIRLKDIDLTIFDYYWTEGDYTQIINNAGLELFTIHKPIGYEDDGYEWQDEKIVSPHSVFIARKL